MTGFFNGKIAITTEIKSKNRTISKEKIDQEIFSRKPAMCFISSKFKMTLMLKDIIVKKSNASKKGA